MGPLWGPITRTTTRETLPDGQDKTLRSLELDALHQGLILPRPEEEKENMGQRRILVAEDQTNDAFILERAFQRTGSKATLHFVRDGQEAIDYLEGQDGFSDRDT